MARRGAYRMVLLAAVLASGAACSARAPVADAGVDAGPLGPAGTFYEEWVAAQEAVVARCWTDPWHTGPFDLYLPEHAGAEIDALVAAGVTQFDPAMAAACLAALEALSCRQDDMFELWGRLNPPECRGVLRGTRGGDSSCRSSFECATGPCDVSYGCPGFCPGHDGGWDSNVEPTDAGMPVATSPWTFDVVEGELCSPDHWTLCVPGLVCGHDASSTGTWRCEPPYESAGSCHFAIPEGCPADQMCDGTLCVPVPGEGEACLASEVNGPRCASGLVCDATTCRRPVPTGDPCTAESICESFRRCSPDGVCVDTIAWCAPFSPPPPQDANYPDSGIDS